MVFWGAGEVPSHVRVKLCCASPLHVRRHVQAAEAAELARGEELLLPPDLDYSALQLSAEDREKLGAARCSSAPWQPLTSWNSQAQQCESEIKVVMQAASCCLHHCNGCFKASAPKPWQGSRQGWR